MRYFFFALFVVFGACVFANVTPEQVYWWWDDGLIEYAEVSDLLMMLESGDDEGACIYAQALGLEKCETYQKSKLSRRKSTSEKKKWGGSLKYAESRDSSDALILRKLEVKTHYDVFAFRGTFAGENLKNATWQLAYNRDEYEALLGEIRYQEVGIRIPLETREGTWLAYNGMLSLGGAIFTDTAAAAMAGINFSDVGFRIWTFDDSENRTIALESVGKNFAVGAWYDEQMQSPLYRLHVDFKKEGAFKILWNGLFYAHEDSVLPYPLKLPATVKKSRYWASQNQKILYGNFTVSFVERLQVPLDSGRTLPYVSTVVQKSKGAVRALVGVSCRDAYSGCGRPQLRFEPGLFINGFLLYCKLRLQGENFDDLEHSPRTALGIKYNAKEKTFFKSEFVIPEHGASENAPYKFNEEAGLNLKNVSVSIRLVFIRRPSESFKSERAGITAGLKF